MLSPLRSAPGAKSPAANKGAAGVDERTVDWKARANEAAARVKELEAEARQQAKSTEKFRIASDRWKERAAEFETLQARLRDLERELAVTRELLMAVEVKLDILEGAANVLDVRTRATIHQPSAETGARS